MCRASRTTQVTVPRGVFWAINESSGNLVWRMNFERVELLIDGDADDFNDTIYDEFRVSELVVHAFST